MHREYFVLQGMIDNGSYLTFIFDIQEKILSVGCLTWEDKVIEGKCLWYLNDILKRTYKILVRISDVL